MAGNDGEVVIEVTSHADVAQAWSAGRRLGQELGFTSSDVVLITTAISELARNIVEHAGRGEVRLEELGDGQRRGLGIVAVDQGPGIADLELAMRDGWSSGDGLGVGLPGSRRLMDEFMIDSAPGQGTRVTARKWLRGA